MSLGFVIFLWQLFLHSYEDFGILRTAAITASQADDLGDGFHESHLLSAESLFPSIYLFLQVLVLPVTSPY